MRIYRRAEFLRLPAGTVFAKGKPKWFGELAVKGETRADSFLRRDVQGFAAHCFGLPLSFAEGFDLMLARGASFPLPSTETRDGAPDRNDVFLVYEADDLDEMIRVFKAARAIADPKFARAEAERREIVRCRLAVAVLAMAAAAQEQAAEDGAPESGPFGAAQRGQAHG